MFNVSEENQSHIMDCHASDNPSVNTFGLSMCCKLTELCFDGVDNDLDGFIDCADADCNGHHLFPTPETDPGLCSNTLVDPDVRSPYNSSTCVQMDPVTRLPIHNPNCSAQFPPPDYFYCSYGQFDDPSIKPQGVCCPEGKRSFWNIAESKWQCIDTTQCGTGPTYRCKFDSFLNLTNWYNDSYYGDVSNWCNTQVTDLYIPSEIPPGYDGSTGCCLIGKHGEINYWIDEDNVKIYG